MLQIQTFYQLVVMGSLIIAAVSLDRLIGQLDKDLEKRGVPARLGDQRHTAGFETINSAPKP